MNREDKRLHAVIQGRVQGVGFRAFVLDQALRLDLTGWVRNTWNGEVEVVAEGPQAALEYLLEKLRTGPRGSFVSRVNVDWEPASGEFDSFEVAHTR